MECPRQKGDAFELMTAYTAGTLEPETQIALDRHMSTCEECRALAAERQAVWEALDDWKPAPISADFNARLYERIASEKAVSWWRRPFRMQWSSLFRPAIPVTAACAALVIAFLVKSPEVKQSTTVPASAQQKVSIEQVERALDDMDMLKQISAPIPAEGQSRERI